MRINDVKHVIPDPVYTLSSDLESCGIRPNRLKGQNYLVSAKVRDYIAGVSNVTKEDSVIEIGPGTGILTWALAHKAGRLVAVESEFALAALLQERFGSCKSVKVVNGDGLEYIRDLAAGKKEGVHKIISNLPYSLTSPVLVTMAAFPETFAGGVLLLQKEVVDRVVAPAGDPDRSALSVIVQMRFNTRKVLKVKPAHFKPKPGVDSAVLTLTPREFGISVPWTYMVTTIFELFAHRRKTVLNNLRKVSSTSTAETILLASGIDTSRRAQELSLEQFVKLAETKMQAELELT